MEPPFVNTQKSTLQMVALIFALVYLPFIYFYGFRYLHFYHVDLPSFYWGAVAAFDWGVSPYGPFALAPGRAEMEQIVWPYLYPPPSLLLFYPFVFFEYETAKALMLLLNHAVFLFLVYLLLFKLKMVNLNLKSPFGVVAFLFFAVYMLSFVPVATNLNHGQINLIVLALIGLTWYGVKEKLGQPAIAVPLALAILLKTYPVLFLPLLLFRKQYGAIAWTLGILVASFGIAWLVLPKEVWGDWFFRVLPTGGYGEEPWGLFSPAAPQNQSINGFAFRLFMENEFTPWIVHSPSLAKLTAYALSLAVIFATLAMSFLSSRITPARGELIDLEFSLYLVMMFLVGPLSWDHHVVYALPAIVLVLHRLVAMGKTFALAFIAAPSALFLSWEVPHWYNRLRWSNELTVLAMSLKFYALMAFWLIGMALLWHRYRALSRTAGQQTTVIAADDSKVRSLFQQT